jgi:RimJ/RimL family protein N-acetyltransferase
MTEAAVAEMPAEITLPSGVTLRRWQASDRDVLISTVNANHAYLREWMPWAAEPATIESATAFLDGTLAAFNAGTDYAYGVFAPDGELLGAGGVHRRGAADVLEIGYWIAAPHAGKGLGRAVARVLTIAAARMPGVERVEIRCDEANARSAAIPRALGYDLVDVVSRLAVAPAETDRHLVWSIPAAVGRAI